MSNQYLTLIRSNRDYRLLLSGLAISLFGDWCNLLAMVAALDQMGWGTASVFGWVFVIKQLPILILAPVAGSFADRYSRRAIMLYSDVARAVVVGLILCAGVFGSPIAMLLLLTVQSSIGAFFEPARSASIPDLVSVKNVGAAGAIGSMLWSTMLIVGTTVGGLLTEVSGWQCAMLVDSASYIVSALFIARIGVPLAPSATSTGENRSALSGLVDLLSYLKSNPSIRALAMVKFWYGIGGAFSLIITLFGQRVFQVGESGALGPALLLAARGIGAFVGPVVGRAIFGSDRQNMRRAILWALLVSAASYLLLGVSSDIFLGAGCLLFGHLGLSIIYVFSSVLLQLEADPQMRGRVIAFDFGMFNLTICVSTVVYGVLIDQGVLTVRAASMVLGGAWIVPAILWIRDPHFWGSRRS